MMNKFKVGDRVIFKTEYGLSSGVVLGQSAENEINKCAVEFKDQYTADCMEEWLEYDDSVEKAKEMTKYLIDEDLLESLILNSIQVQRYKPHHVIADDIKKSQAILDAGPIDMSDDAMNELVGQFTVGSLFSAGWCACWQYLSNKMEGK